MTIVRRRGKGKRAYLKHFPGKGKTRKRPAPTPMSIRTAEYSQRLKPFDEPEDHWKTRIDKENNELPDVSPAAALMRDKTNIPRREVQTVIRERKQGIRHQYWNTYHRIEVQMFSKRHKIYLWWSGDECFFDEYNWKEGWARRSCKYSTSVWQVKKKKILWLEVIPLPPPELEQPTGALPPSL